MGTRQKLRELYINEFSYFKKIFECLSSQDFNAANIEYLKNLELFNEEKLLELERIANKQKEGAMRKQKWDTFRQEALNHMDREYIHIEALHALGKGMFTYIPTQNPKEQEEVWKTWKTCETETLSEQIQGRLNREEFAQMFEKNIEGTNAFQTKARFLARFIRDPKTSEQELKSFVSFVTGAESLPKGTEITLIQRVGVPTALPQVHACCNQIELYSEFISSSDSNKLSDDTYEIS